jgi:hypothetical protein
MFYIIFFDYSGCSRFFSILLAFPLHFAFGEEQNRDLVFDGEQWKPPTFSGIFPMPLGSRFDRSEASLLMDDYLRKR